MKVAFDQNFSHFNYSADIWKDYRKVLNSTFNVKILRNFISIFNDKDIVLADKLKVHLGAGQFDVYKSVGKCALDNICGEFKFLDEVSVPLLFNFLIPL